MKKLLNSRQIDALFLYKHECNKGLVHTTEVDAKFKELQEIFNNQSFSDTWVDKEPWWVKFWPFQQVSFQCKPRPGISYFKGGQV
jgi:hypothetical protein